MIFDEVCTKPGNFEQITETEQELQNLSELHTRTCTLCMACLVVIQPGTATTRSAAGLATNEAIIFRWPFLAAVVGNSPYAVELGT